MFCISASLSPYIPREGMRCLWRGQVVVGGGAKGTSYRIVGYFINPTDDFRKIIKFKAIQQNANKLCADKL